MMARSETTAVRTVRPVTPTAARLALIAMLALVPGVASGAEPSSVRQRELASLVRNDCGACHGMRLTGGLGPALTPDTLKDKPADGLVATILAGRPGTAMPPWRPFLSEVDAEWLAARLIDGGFDAPR
jgi:cytochrome c55X